MSVKGKVDLLSNATGNGSDKNWSGGKTAFLAEAGAFNAATVKLQVKTGQGTYIDVTGSGVTANGMVILDLPAGTYRAVAGAATGTYVSLVSVPSY